MRWTYLSIPKLQRWHRWSLGMNKWLHPTLFWVCNYLSILGLKLISICKRCHCSRLFECKMPRRFADSHFETLHPPSMPENKQLGCSPRSLTMPSTRECLPSRRLRLFSSPLAQQQRQEYEKYIIRFAKHEIRHTCNHNISHNINKLLMNINNCFQ